MSRTRTTSRWALPVLALVLFFGVIVGAQATGLWVTSGRSLVVGSSAGLGAGTGSGPGTGTGSGSGSVAAGSLGSADLKGWMTLQQAADGLGMPVADLVALIAPPAGVTLDGGMALKDVEPKVPGFSLADLRATVAAATGR